jgi:hypothetical protein
MYTNIPQKELINIIYNTLTNNNTPADQKCKKCTIERAPTFVAYGGFYIYWLIHAQQDAYPKD